jgi:hypothetical protein
MSKNKNGNGNGNGKDDDYTGKLFEFDVLKNGINIFCPDSVPKYKPWKVAMAEVIAKVNYSKWDPSDPDSRICNDLHATVAMEIGIDNWNDLRLFPAVGSSFDVHHGVDMFFMLGKKYATIDLTINGEKGKHKADLNITPECLENLGDLAKKIKVYLTKGV